jgi:hypothetical protein
MDALTPDTILDYLAQEALRIVRATTDEEDRVADLLASAREVKRVLRPLSLDIQSAILQRIEQVARLDILLPGLETIEEQHAVRDLARFILKAPALL